MKKTILVVDDDVSFARALQAILSCKGYYVDIAHTSEEALAKTLTYDVVLMDMKLPSSNGVRTFMAIKDIHKETAGILMTGHAMDMADQVKQALDSGLMHNCLYKPLDVEELLMELEQIWSAKHTTEIIPLARVLTFLLIAFVLWSGFVIIFPFVGNGLLYRVEQPVEVVRVNDYHVKLHFVQHSVLNLVVDTAEQLHCDTVQVMPSRIDTPVAKGEQAFDEWVVLPSVAINGGRGIAKCYYTGTMSYSLCGAWVVHHWTSETFSVPRKGH